MCVEVPNLVLDYAPKAQASKSGTLSEEYGLEKVKLHEQNAADEGDSSIGQFAPNGTPANDQSAQPKGTFVNELDVLANFNHRVHIVRNYNRSDFVFIRNFLNKLVYHQTRFWV